MARIRNELLGLVILATGLTGCVTGACDPYDSKLGKDCYECTRKLTVEAEQVDPDTGRRLSSKEQIKDRTEECLRERGYVKKKKKEE